MKFSVALLSVMLSSVAFGQSVTPLDLQVDYVDGVLVFKPSDACLTDTCHTTIKQLKEALTHITVRKPDKKGISFFLPFKIGNTSYYLTYYHYPFSTASTDTILRLENDSIIIHDIGADGLLTDSTKEYCINKKTQQRLDWQSNYNTLMQAGVCPINCFMRDLHARGYNGYVLQLQKDGHTAIMFY